MPIAMTYECEECRTAKGYSSRWLRILDLGDGVFSVMKMDPDDDVPHPDDHTEFICSEPCLYKRLRKWSEIRPDGRLLPISA